jgi:heme-degrading monooxygenase HmoA
MRRTLLCLCTTAVLLLTALFANFGFTQAKKAPSTAPPQAPPYRVMAMQVKPGMGIAWENFLKTDLVPALKKAGVHEFSVWKTAQFGGFGDYFLMTTMESLAALDGPNPLVKALGQEAAAALMAKLQTFVASGRSYVIEPRANLTIEPKPGYVLKMGVLVTNSVAPGRTEEFEKNSKAVMAAIAKTNAKGFLTARVGLGGDPNEYTTLVPFDSFADLEKFIPAFMKAAAEVKLLPEAGVVMHRKYEVISSIPGLSIEPPAPKAAK